MLGRKSDNSLYDNSLVSFDEVGDYNQKDAEGFIKVNSVRLKKNNLSKVFFKNLVNFPSLDPIPAVGITTV